MKIFEILFRHKRVTVAIACAAWILAVFFASGIKWRQNILELLPGEDEKVNAYKRLVSAFDLMDMMFITVGSRENKKAPEQKLISASEELTRKMRGSGLFEKIILEWKQDDLFSIIETLRKNRPALFNRENAKELNEKISKKKLEARLAHWKKLLTESPAPGLSDMLCSDPLGLDLPMLEKLNSLKNIAGKLKPRNGKLFSADGRQIAIFAKPKYPASDMKQAKKLTAFMNKLIAGIEKKKPEEIRVAYLSGHRHSVENATRLKGGIAVSATLSILAVFALSCMIYRRPLLILLTLLPALFGCASGLAATRLVYPNVSAIAIGCGSMLIGITVDYGIHILYHLDGFKPEQFDDGTVINLLKRLARPLTMSAATTILAFLTLQFSVLPGYRQLSFFASVGVASAAAFSLLVLPLLVPRPKKQSRRRTVISSDGFFPAMFNKLQTNRKYTIAAIAILSLLAAFGLSKVDFEGDIGKINATNASIEADKAILFKTFGDPTKTATVAVAGKNSQKALELNENIYSELVEMKKDGIIETFSSISAMLPCEATGRKNIARWRKFWNKQTKEQFIFNLNYACKKQGMRPGYFKKFTASLEAPAQVPGVKDFDGTALENAFSNMMSPEENGEAFVLNRVRLTPSASFKKFSERLERKNPQVIVYRGQDFVKYIIGMIHKEIKKAGLLSLAAIAALLWVVFRKPWQVLTTITPLFLSLLWTFGIMGWLGIKINIMNCIVAIFIFGLVVDYCIFLSTALESEEGRKDLDRTGGAVTFSALTTAFGLGALLLGGHPALVSLGMTAVIGIISGLLATFMIEPALSRKSC